MNIEKTDALLINFEKIKKIASQGLAVVPVVVQDIKTKEVLVLAYTNEIAFKKTQETKLVHFWSTSKNKLWLKGEESQNYLELVEMRINCEQNALLYLVNLQGAGACHVTNKDNKPFFSCFYRKVNLNSQKLTF
ncbi:MAG: phosphoribosyl-AMP cyclohydrolase [Candidatus Margulisiibacteriota bacterium]|jgi:phosphoribosyl-AMP cyclohydrolase